MELSEKSYAEVRYESLVNDPVTAVKQVCRFLRIPYDPNMLDFSKRRKQRNGPSLSANDARLPPTPGLRDWRRQMPEDHQLRFEAAVGPLLDELGLERRYKEPPLKALEHADRMRKQFFDPNLRASRKRKR